MKKISFFFALLLSLIATNVMGETLITPENFSTLQAGTYVSLQCRDTNGGPGWYLNGAAAKSETFSYANIYQLVTKGEGLALKNVKTGDFVGNTSNLVSNVDETNAVTFEIKNKGIEGNNLEIQNWTTQQEGNVVDNTCRFIVKGTSTFLNTNDKASTPKYAGGKGGYSIWYVYTYTAEEVVALTVNTGIYRIKNEYNGRGELVYNENYDNVQLNNITLTGYAKNNVAPTGNGTYWYVRPFKGKLYFYNVEANKFLQNSSNAVVYSANVNDQCAFNIDRQTESDVEYIRVISPTDGNKFLSTSCGWEPGPNQVKFRSHEAASDYLSFIEDEGEDMEKYAEQVAAANNLIEGLVDVTYNYVFGGDTVKTETFAVCVGNARPAATVPYACEANLEAVPEIITEAGTYDIPVNTTTAFPFAFSADYDNAKWYTIKMRSGYAGCDGTYFPETNLTSQPSEAKYLYAFQGNPYAIKVLLPNGKYMINGGANNEKSTFGDEGTGFGIIACNDQVTFTIDGANGTINDVQKSIGFWADGASYTDGGSKMDIQSVADINVYNIVFAEGAPAAGGVVYDGNTYSASSAFNAVSSADELTAEEFTGVEVAGYSVAVAISGRTVTVTYTATKSAAWLALSGLIYDAQQMNLPTEGPWGTDPGFYNQEGVEALPGAITVAQGVLETETTDDVYEAATTTLAAAVNAAKMIMPEVGKTYQMISAFPTFETTHGYKMAIYSTGSVMRWMGVNNNAPAFFWTVTAVDGKNVTFQNLKDGKYPSTFNTNDQPIPMTETENVCVLALLGDGQFSITSTGSKAAIHAGNHGNGNNNNGNVMIWNTGKDGCSAWYIHEANVTSVESYDAMNDGAAYLFTTNGRGAITYSSDKGRMTGVKPANYNDPNQAVAVIKINETNSYLYSVAQGKFINFLGNYAVVENYPTQENAWIIKNGPTAAYPIMIDSEDGLHVNLNNTSDLVVNGYSTPDAGNQFAVYEVGAADATALLTSLKANIAAALADSLPTGNLVGMYIADSLAKVKLALQEAPQATIEECIIALEDYGVALKSAIKQVEAGKYYIFESAYVEFTNREKHMGIYTNGTQAAWKAIDVNDPAFYAFAEEASDGNAQFKFIQDGKYIAANAGMLSNVNGMNYVSIGSYRYALQPEGTANFMNPGGHSGGTANSGNIAIWGTASSLSNEWYILEVTLTLAAADSLLKADIARTFKTGIRIGSYSKAKIDQAKLDAQTALDNPERTVESVLAAHNAFLAAIDVAYNRPEVGKTYLLVSAYEAFENNQGVEKAAYIDGKTSGWNTIDETKPIFWWTVTAVEGDNVCFQNVASRKYLKHYVANNAYTALSDRPFPFYCKDLGANIFSLYLYDEVAMTTNGPLHPNSHNSGKGVSGDWRSWGQDTHEQNRWYIIEKSDADVVLVNYVVKDGEDTIMYRPTPAIIGEAYPVLDNTNPFGTLSDYPTGVVAEGGDVELTYTADFEVAKNVESITKWYAIDSKPSTDKRPLVGVSAGSNIKAAVDTDDYKNGAVKGDDMMWAIVGNPFGFVQLYNKGTGLYAAKKQAGQKKLVTMEEVGDDLVLMQPAVAYTNGFSIRKFGDDVTLWNSQSNSLGGWDSATDAGSVLSIHEVNYNTTSFDLINAEEYGTFIAPFYAEIPEDLEVYTCDSVVGTTLALDPVEGLIKANVPYITKGKGTFVLNPTSVGNYTDPATAGLLTGVYEPTTAPVASYVLQKNALLGFYQVATDAQPTVGANRCYLTLPEPEAKALFFEETTGIDDVDVNADVNRNGKFFENGKIVIVKNNARYNVAGQSIK